MNNAYGELAIHRWMLRDAVRNEGYRRAIAQVVKPGDVVLDMGAGTGILSIFAAQAGARKVFAVERTEVAGVARRMVTRNGFDDRIEVLQADLENVNLSEKVDVIISEWMGGFGVDENMLAPLIMARDRWLKPGGKIVPERVTAYIAPASVLDFDEAMTHWQSRPHGVDVSVIAEITTNEMFMTQTYLTPDDLLAEAKVMWSHDAYTCTLEEADRSFESKQTFTSQHPGAFSGFVTWFAAELCEGCTLTNAVGAPDTHWGRILFPLDHAIDVTTGTRIQAEVHCDPAGPGSCEFYWSAKIADGRVEEHDTRRARQSRRTQF